MENSHFFLIFSLGFYIIQQKYNENDFHSKKTFANVYDEPNFVETILKNPTGKWSLGANLEQNNKKVSSAYRVLYGLLYYLYSVSITVWTAARQTTH